MTKHQQEVIEIIKEVMIERGRLEIKEEICSELGFNKLSFVLRVGVPNDAGSLAALICSVHKHFIIGARGGVKLVSTWSNGRHCGKSIRGLTKALRYSL
jgi:hypothetical protein